MSSSTDAPPPQPTRRVLLTGATGYVGGRLAPRLVAAGLLVRCLVRSSRKLASRPWHRLAGIEVVEGDLEDAAVVEAALRDCEAAYYLVHAPVRMGPRETAAHSQMAARFAKAAERAGVGRIVYLGGLAETRDGLHRALSERQEVARALAGSSVPVTVLRAPMILGTGSVAFETLRYLAERLPVMVTPRWVRVECQPIAIRNVLDYLVRCLEIPETAGATLELGGPETVTYQDLLGLLAEALSLRRRWVLRVPFWLPRLSAAWVHMWTPVDYEHAWPIVEGLRRPLVCGDGAKVLRLMPQRLLPVREAIGLALGKLRDDRVETAWSDAGPMPGDPDWTGGTVFEDRRRLLVQASAEQVFQAICRVGGEQGYHAGSLLWKLRGWMDKCLGGPGLDRGRRQTRRLHCGDALDFWRVVEIEPPRQLRLRAEMRVPGEAELEFRTEAPGAGQEASACWLVQIARFKPKGLLGLAYWYSVMPFHGIVFPGMLRGIARAAVTGPHPSLKGAAEMGPPEQGV